MEGISDIRIIGMDEKRPPRIRKEPYIDLYFRLPHKAPLDGRQDFTELQSRQDYGSKINGDECLYIETWVRTPGEIAGLDFSEYGTRLRTHRGGGCAALFAQRLRLALEQRTLRFRCRFRRHRWRCQRAFFAAASTSAATANESWRPLAFNPSMTPA